MKLLRQAGPDGDLRPGLCFFCVILHHLVDDAADGVRRLPAHPLGGVGIGVQGEPGGVVAYDVLGSLATIF